MRNFLKQTTFPLVFMLICFSSNAQNKQTKSASFYHYETECLEDKLDGNFVFMAWGAGSSKKEAIDQAKRNAINDILFKGVNKSTCNVRQSPSKTLSETAVSFLLKLGSELCGGTGTHGAGDLTR